MGGERAFVNKLGTIFALSTRFGLGGRRGPIHEMREMQVANMGQYAHGKQPIQHMTYLYGYSNEPWKGQYWIRETMDRLYHAGPDGYCGDEDNGQTSAWYVFSALGFYPVCPGTDQYVLGTPLFKHVRVQLAKDRILDIQAPENGPANRYIKQLAVNGAAYTKAFLTHNQLMDGATLLFTMSDQPDTDRPVQQTDLPYSLSMDER